MALYAEHQRFSDGYVRFLVYRYLEQVSLQLALEEFKYGLRPNDGGKVVPDGR